MNWKYVVGPFYESLATNMQFADKWASKTQHSCVRSECTNLDECIFWCLFVQCYKYNQVTNLFSLKNIYWFHVNAKDFKPKFKRSIEFEDSAHENTKDRPN